MFKWYLQRTMKTSSDVFIKEMEADGPGEARDELLTEWNSMDPREQANTDEFLAIESLPEGEGYDPNTVMDIVNRNTVWNLVGVRYNFLDTIQYMDRDLRELLTAELAPFTYQEFFDAYAVAHKKKFKKIWCLNTIKGCIE